MSYFSSRAFDQKNIICTGAVACLQHFKTNRKHRCLTQTIGRKPGSPFLDSGLAEITPFPIEVSVNSGPMVHGFAGSLTTTLEKPALYLSKSWPEITVIDR